VAVPSMFATSSSQSERKEEKIIMGIREEQLGTVVSGPAIIGEPWWLLSNAAGTAICCHRAESWFCARGIACKLAEQENCSAELIFQEATK
jgi:hypothetical protein